MFYQSIVNITAQNNFSAGKIFVDNTEWDAPKTFSKNVGDNAILKAKEQTDNLGYSRIWNDVELWNAKSSWLKNGVFFSDQIEKNFTVAQNDNNAIYEAGLRKNYAISRNDQTEFDGTVSAGIVTHIVEQNSGNVPIFKFP